MPRAASVLVVAVLAVVALAVADEPPRPEMAAALAKVADRSNIDITTIGRKSGKRHTRPIWFVVSDGKIFVQAGKDGKTDWYLNLQKTPSVTLRQGEFTFETKARAITDADEAARVRHLFTQKYTTAWLLSFLGSSIGRGKSVELTPITVGASP